MLLFLVILSKFNHEKFAFAPFFLYLCTLKRIITITTMKDLFRLLFVGLIVGFSFASCVGCPGVEDNYPDPAPGSYAYGADCSWITEEEQDGVLFYDSLGQATEGMRLMRSVGMNAVRLRVWVNHSTGWCNKEDVLLKAKRANALKLRLMIDFHYSDYFADPSRQTTPAAWADYDLEQLKQAVADHTTEVLTALRDSGVSPEWIQVGNETRCGMLWPTGRLWDTNGDIEDGWKNYAALTLSGYNACKAVFPDALVIVHIDNAYENNNWFFRKMKQNGGKFDMIGLSHYPMMTEWTGKTWQEVNRLAAQNIQLLYKEFGCPIMIAEIGTIAAEEATGVRVVEDFRARIDTLDYVRGMFYWEPQVYNGWRPREYETDGWGAYNMGAFTSKGQPNKSLKALWRH